MLGLGNKTETTNCKSNAKPKTADQECFEIQFHTLFDGKLMTMLLSQTKLSDAALLACADQAAWMSSSFDQPFASR